MKIALLFQEEHLVSNFRQHIRHPEEVIHFTQPDVLLDSFSNLVFDYAAVSESSFQHNSALGYVEELLRVHPKERMCIIFANENKEESLSLLKFCLAQGIYYIPAGLTNKARIEKLISHIYGESEEPNTAKANKTVMFMGTTPNIGTTVISFGSAVRLAMETSNAIGYLCLNLKSSKLHRYLGIERPSITLDGIRAEVRAQSLRGDKLKQYCHSLPKLPNLNILFGNMLREQAEFFTPTDIKYVLSVAKEIFDICIVEVNAYWDNAATICVMEEADSKWIVTTSNITQFQEDIERWLHSLAPELSISPRSFDLIVNQIEVNESQGYKPREIGKECGMQVVGEVRHYSNIMDYMNRGKLLELYMGNHPIRLEMSRLSNVIIGMYSLTRIKPRVARTWFRNFLYRAGAS